LGVGFAGAVSEATEAIAIGAAAMSYLADVSQGARSDPAPARIGFSGTRVGFKAISYLCLPLFAFI
jgi:hypothetical protein